MSRISQLFELQQIDSGLDSRLTRLRQIDEQMVDGPALLAARVSYDEARTVLSERQAELKRVSHDAEEVSVRLKTQEKRLYDGSIKNPKELSQVQEEVWHLKDRFKSLEESVFEAMVLVEDAEVQVGAKNKERENSELEQQQFHSGLSEEKDKLVEQAKVLQLKRQRAIEGIEWADLQAYERLRRSKGGVAVVPVKGQGGICSGCHVGVTAHILRAARAGSDIVPCPNCGRILYPTGEVKFEDFNHDLDNVAR